MKDSLMPDLDDKQTVVAETEVTVTDSNAKKDSDDIAPKSKVITNPKKDMNENLKPVYTDSVTKDIASTKKFAWLAYILFFIPLLINRHSSFVKHNANQGLKLNIIDILSAVLLIIGSVVKTTSQSWHLVLVVLVYIGLGLIALTLMLRVYMIIVCLKGKEAKTPILSDAVIIK